MRNCLLLFIAAVLSGSCAETSITDNELKKQVTAFAEAYFNYNMPEAQKYVTPESVKWLQFASSNITQENLDALNKEDDAEIEIEDCQETDDSTRLVSLYVSSYYTIASIENSECTNADGIYQLTLVKRNKEWLIKMEGLPQSEKPDRD